MSQADDLEDSLNPLAIENSAILAHTDRERVLVVKVRGYNDWMLPYGKYQEGELAIETARRVLYDMVCCRDVSYAQDLVEEVRIPFSRIDRDTWDMAATANFHMDRNLHLYVADLACGPQEMSKGRRVESFNLVRYDRLDSFLVGEELSIVKDIMIDIRAGRI